MSDSAKKTVQIKNVWGVGCINLRHCLFVGDMLVQNNWKNCTQIQPFHCSQLNCELRLRVMYVRQYDPIEPDMFVLSTSRDGRKNSYQFTLPNYIRNISHSVKMLPFTIC